MGVAAGSTQFREPPTSWHQRHHRQHQPPPPWPSPVLRLSRRPCMPRARPASTSTGVPSAAGTTVSSWACERSSTLSFKSSKNTSHTAGGAGRQRRQWGQHGTPVRRCAQRRQQGRKRQVPQQAGRPCCSPRARQPTQPTNPVAHPPVGVFTSTTVPFLRYSRPPCARLSTIFTLRRRRQWEGCGEKHCGDPAGAGRA